MLIIPRCGGCTARREPLCGNVRG